MLNENNLNLAGWMAVLNATLSLVLILFISSTGSNLLTSSLSLTTAALTVYLLNILKQLLNQRANFYAGDAYISIIIWFTVAFAVLEVFSIPLSFIGSLYEALALILLIPLGIIYILWGYKLLQCESDLYGYLKPYAYLIIITGISMATVIFILLGFFTGLISDVLLALLFLRAAKES